MFTGKNWWGASSTQNTRAAKQKMRFGCLPPRNAPVISRLRARRATSVLGHAPRAEQPLSTATQDRVCSRASSQDSSATLNRRARAQRSPGTAALQSQQIITRWPAPKPKKDAPGTASRVRGTPKRLRKPALAPANAAPIGATIQANSRSESRISKPRQDVLVMLEWALTV